MIGMHTETAPSKATMTLRLLAAAKISLPCVASNALLAVTMCLPLSIAASIASFATPVPPMTSTTMSISGSRTTRITSSVSGTSGPMISRARCQIARRNPRDLDSAPRATRDLFAIALQDAIRSAPDGPDAEQSDLNRLHVHAPWRQAHDPDHRARVLRSSARECAPSLPGRPENRSRSQRFPHVRGDRSLPSQPRLTR